MKKLLLLTAILVIGLAACTDQAGESSLDIVDEPQEQDDPGAAEMEEGVKDLGVTSPAFTNGGQFPVKYTCDGMDINPALRINNPLHRTESLAVIVVDPDTASGDFIHWVMWNIDPIEVIPEDTAPGVEGLNDFGRVGYGGPCPPGSQPHRYFFQVYALNTTLDLSRGATKADLVEAMRDHVIAKGRLVGRYVRG